MWCTHQPSRGTSGPGCEGSEGHQRSVGWTNRYHTVYNTYKCCTGHLFMKTAWSVSKSHRYTHTLTLHMISGTLYTDQYWGHPCLLHSYICTHIRTYTVINQRLPYSRVSNGSHAILRSGSLNSHFGPTQWSCSARGPR